MSMNALAWNEIDFATYQEADLFFITSKINFWKFGKEWLRAGKNTFELLFMGP